MADHHVRGLGRCPRLRFVGLRVLWSAEAGKQRRFRRDRLKIEDDAIPVGAGQVGDALDLVRGQTGNELADVSREYTLRGE